MVIGQELLTDKHLSAGLRSEIKQTNVASEVEENT